MSNLNPLDSFFNSLYATNLFLFIIIVGFLANEIFKIVQTYYDSKSLFGLSLNFAISVFLSLIAMLMLLLASDSLIMWFTSTQNAI